MKKLLSIFLTCMLLVSFSLVPSEVKATIDSSSDKLPFTQSMANFKMEEQRLWIEHVLWTRNFIISDLASLEDKDTVLDRLLKNQDDIGNSIKPYYGDIAGNKLSKLLREHISIAGQIVDAAKEGNKNDVDKYNTLWYENADKIADFLSAANPNWSNKELKDILHMHLKLTTDEVVARLNKDWNADVQSFDKGEKHILILSDAITNGIIKQFPNKFSK